jgi:8-amino-7-oxononanoate synthase
VLEPNRLPDGSEVITPIVPVLVGDDWQAVMLWKALYDAGVYVNVAIYPAVQRGGALLRTSVMATHERQHLDRALGVFERVKDEVAEAPPPVATEPPAATPEAGADQVRSGS